MMFSDTRRRARHGSRHPYLGLSVAIADLAVGRRPTTPVQGDSERARLRACSRAPPGRLGAPGGRIRGPRSSAQTKGLVAPVRLKGLARRWLVAVLCSPPADFDERPPKGAAPAGHLCSQPAGRLCSRVPMIPGPAGHCLRFSWMPNPLDDEDVRPGSIPITVLGGNKDRANVHAAFPQHWAAAVSGDVLMSSTPRLSRAHRADSAGAPDGHPNGTKTICRQRSACGAA